MGLHGSQLSYQPIVAVWELKRTSVELLLPIKQQRLCQLSIENLLMLCTRSSSDLINETFCFRPCLPSYYDTSFLSL
jgi:hypothetical protein